MVMPQEALKEEVLRNIEFIGRFGDISELLGKPALREKIVGYFRYWLKVNHMEMRIDRIAGVETRGAVLAMAVAHDLHLPYSMIRRGGKLHKGLSPLKKEFTNYKGSSDSLEVSPRHFPKGENVVIVDDWFETGQSAMAAKELIERCGASVVAFCTIVNDTSGNPDAQVFFAKLPFLSIVNLKR
jgi:adenine phosphoribosyltransferase